MAAEWQPNGSRMAAEWQPNGSRMAAEWQPFKSCTLLCKSQPSFSSKICVTISISQ
ncbi:MAG: hypothetical protein FWE44_03895 [Defluviitaleaceae bacterium]|nr:hypothetical protein [Defluviitaleaceae bacterium]